MPFLVGLERKEATTVAEDKGHAPGWGAVVGKANNSTHAYAYLLELRRCVRWRSCFVASGIRAGLGYRALGLAGLLGIRHAWTLLLKRGAR